MNDNLTTKQKLKKRKVNMAEIARSLNVSRVAVYLVVEGKSKSARITQAIEEAISKPVPETTTKEKDTCL
jgi:predicted DNA-binding protein YlxM (UPF0122 family)